jgi:hypothetical protein
MVAIAIEKFLHILRFENGRGGRRECPNHLGFPASSQLFSSQFLSFLRMQVLNGRDDCENAMVIIY